MILGYLVISLLTNVDEAIQKRMAFYSWKCECIKKCEYLRLDYLSVTNK